MRQMSLVGCNLRTFSRKRETGVTLIELLVAMVMSLVVIAAASSVFLLSSQSFSSVDSNSQLQDSARFATYILRRMVQQVGYEDYSQSTGNSGRNQTDYTEGSLSQWDPAASTCSRADLCGYDNKIVKPIDIRSQSAPASTSGTLSEGFFTDTLVVQFHGQGTIKKNSFSTNSGDVSGTVADGSMIDCSGTAVASSTSVPPSRAMSVLYVSFSPTSKEPELYCSTIDQTDATKVKTWSLLKGVESFQVIYEIGDDTSVATANKSAVGLPDRYRWLRASEIDTFKTTQPPPKETPQAVFSWQNVVAVRFGLVLRGDINSAPPLVGSPQPLYPLGKELASASDPGTIYTPPDDTRLRRVVTFTTHIRNSLMSFRATPPLISP